MQEAILEEKRLRDAVGYLGYSQFCSLGKVVIEREGREIMMSGTMNEREAETGKAYMHELLVTYSVIN